MKISVKYPGSFFTHQPFKYVLNLNTDGIGNCLLSPDKDQRFYSLCISPPQFPNQHYLLYSTVYQLHTI